jgi:hypothetical protein
MVSDTITRKDAHLRTWWKKLPFGVRQSIKTAVDEGRWWIDVVKEMNADGKPEVNKTTLIALEELGYMVHYADDESMATYRISWE